MIESKLNDTQCGFRPGRSTTDEISLPSKFLWNLGSMPKTSTHALSTSRKHKTGVLVKYLWSIAGVRCWRPPVMNCQVTVFLIRSLGPCQESLITTVHRWCWIPTRVCAVILFHSLRESDRQSQPSRWGCPVGSCRINRLLFDDLVQLLNRVFSMHSIVFSCVPRNRNEDQH